MVCLLSLLILWAQSHLGILHEHDFMQKSSSKNVQTAVHKSLRKCHFFFSGFNPRWDCTFNFTVHVPDLALVRFMVEDHDFTSSNDFLGQYTLPFNSLRTGVFRDSTFWIIWELFKDSLEISNTIRITICSPKLLFLNSAGFRHVRLLKLDGSSLSPASLFIHVTVSPCQNSPCK